MKRKYLAVIATVVLSLPFSQLPVTTANAAICQGEAAYPPDLPDCLSPVVAAEQAAAAKAAADAAAAAAGGKKEAETKPIIFDKTEKPPGLGLANDESNMVR